MQAHTFPAAEQRGMVQCPLDACCAGGRSQLPAHGESGTLISPPAPPFSYSKCMPSPSHDKVNGQPVYMEYEALHLKHSSQLSRLICFRPFPAAHIGKGLQRKVGHSSQ